MGRLPRFDAPGTTHHLTALGAGPCPIYLDPVDRLIFLAIAARTVARRGWTCLAYCLMTTHYHLVVRTPNGDLSDGMERLNGDYARSFNGRHGRRGHLFGSRFGSTWIQTNEQYAATIRYVALNPLDAGVQPSRWPWSSYRTASAGALDPLAANGEVIAFFGGVERLRVFVEEGVRARAA